MYYLNIFREAKDQYEFILVEFDNSNGKPTILYDQNDQTEEEKKIVVSDLERLLKNVADHLKDYARFNFQNNPEDQENFDKNIKTRLQTLYEMVVPNTLRVKLNSLEKGSVLNISSSEELFPWEILHNGTDYLGNHFQIFHSPRIKDTEEINAREEKKLPDRQYTIQTLYHLIGGGLTPEDSATINESFHLLNEKLGEKNVQIRERIAFDSFKEDMAKNYDYIHLTCHTRDCEDCKDKEECKTSGNQGPYLQINDKKFPLNYRKNITLTNLREINFKKTSSPFVFINACASAGLTLPYDAFTSFAWKFYSRGAGVCIGTRGETPVDTAANFVEKFVHYMDKEKYDLFEAFFKAKEALQSDFFQVLYALYGDYYHLKKRKLQDIYF